MKMEEIVNTNVLDLFPYQAGKPVEELQREHRLERIVKLASNENPFPVPRDVVQAITQEITHIHTYPESDCYFLKHRLAEYHGTTVENIIIGAGSVELIRLLISAFLKPGEKVLTSEKTFMMYKISAIEKGGKSAFVQAPMGKDYTFDLDAIYGLVDEKTKIIFITNPNNPTGTMIPKQKLMEFIDKIPQDKIIALDHAYHEYVTDTEHYLDGVELAQKRKNIIVLRTFSKIYAMAGMRVGFGIAHPELLEYLYRVKPPFNVTRLAQVAALASLENDGFKRQSAELNTRNKEKLYRQLRELELPFIPSQTNFILFFPGVEIKTLNQILLREGVIIRPLQAFGVPEGMRVTVGTEEDNDFFIDKLKIALAEMSA